MRAKMLLAALATAVVAAGAVTSLSAAAPNPAPTIVMAPFQVMFGAVPVGTMVIRPVQIVNMTGQWVEYGGASWPNFDYPGYQVQPFPRGFWEVDPANPYGNSAPFPCWEIAPRSSCTLYFDWLPYETGTHSAHFGMWYVSEADGKTIYSSNVIMLIGTGQPQR